MTNKPYVRKLDSDGNVINPITKYEPHLHNSENRRARRERQYPGRFRGNNKGHSIVVVGNLKYYKVLQRLKDRTINH